MSEMDASCILHSLVDVKTVCGVDLHPNSGFRCSLHHTTRHRPRQLAQATIGIGPQKAPEPKYPYRTLYTKVDGSLVRLQSSVFRGSQHHAGCLRGL